MMQRKNVEVNFLERLQLHVYCVFGENFCVFPYDCKRSIHENNAVRCGDKVIVNKLAKTI